MARLRPRTKQFLLAGAIGAVSILIISVGVMYWGYGYMSKEKRQLQARYEEDLHQAKEIIGQYEASHTKVWLLGEELEAGQVLKSEHFVQADLLSSAVPLNAIDKEQAIGKITKIPLKVNTLLVESMIFEEEPTPPDLRTHEYNMLRLPRLLNTGDFVDVRISFPGGQDYIVMSKKKVQNLADGTVWYELNEEEIMMMSSAIVDAYLNHAYLYAIAYVDPYMQSEAIVTYPANDIVRNLMENNPNIVSLASNGLAERERKRLEDQLKEMNPTVADGYKNFGNGESAQSQTPQANSTEDAAANGNSSLPNTGRTETGGGSSLYPTDPTNTTDNKPPSTVNPNPNPNSQSQEQSIPDQQLHQDQNDIFSDAP
ncbi:SAF domain-containing protein [Paenibacillus harenae]|uniref:Type II secretory pathway pseudopilin PulG n=1 Tax=Paenibacillus harenae TaxID=306543 RepID=A0ABT9TTJ7_PAEHA|nr:SAF domain-containing protein [Paenibacillus harenae]MDQ0110659.1 type II secretory pathway pseudopilin PulG [Paenibacillus harenae]